MREKSITILGVETSLFVKGEILSQDSLAVAVVGARNASEKGIRFTEEFVKVFVAAGVTIVSGGARGIDTVAHRTALEEGGRTIAVLGCGVDIAYPAENRELFEEISRSGALVSQFPLGAGPLAENFKMRNAIIAGLSKAVLVVEGQRKSGTMNTASHAANQGIEVFAIPGSPGTDWLIGEGATIANDPAIILEYLIGNINYGLTNS